MNTLNKTITSSFFASPEGYAALKARWSQIVNSNQKHDLTAAHHLIYAILRGKNWQKGFTSPRQDPNWSYATPVVAFHALAQARYASSPAHVWFKENFGDILSPEYVSVIKSLTISPTGYDKNTQTFVNALEVDAYVTPGIEVAA